jgi:hypothetical protein
MIYELGKSQDQAADPSMPAGARGSSTRFTSVRSSVSIRPDLAGYLEERVTADPSAT